MKGKILKLVTILSLFMLMLSCGSDKKEEAKQEGHSKRGLGGYQG